MLWPVSVSSFVCLSQVRVFIKISNKIGISLQGKANMNSYALDRMMLIFNDLQ